MNRRTLLKSSAAAGAIAFGSRLAFPSSHGLSPGAELRTKRVILVAFAGGVRTKETLGTPDNVPNLKRMAEEGVAYTRARTSNLGHFGATMSVFTGIAEARGIRDNTRGEAPTLFEYVRKGLALEASEVWVSTSGGAQQSNYSYSLHPEYGARYGANTLDGDGIFNAEFKSILDAYGKPREMEAREVELLEEMRGVVGRGNDREGVNTPKSFAQIERFLLEELTTGTVDLRGTGAADAKALRIARNLLAVFKPKLLGVVLQNADVAHGSFNAYVEVIRRNDVMLGELWQAVKDDSQTAESTSIFVLPEFGRDADLNSRRGLDHGDGSDDLQYVSCVAWGPDFRRGIEILEEVRTIDVCPTICHMLGVEKGLARGKRLPKLLR